jgi:biotin carboxylase
VPRPAAAGARAAPAAARERRQATVTSAAVTFGVASGRDNGAVASDAHDRGRSLLALGAGPAQLGLLAAAKASGIWVAVCDRDPAAPGFALADRRCLVATDDEPAVERLASALPLDGLIAPGTDRPVAVAARVAERLGLPHPISSATGLLATSSLRQREALADAGVPQPRFAVTSGPDDVAVPLPLVVKAGDRAGRGGLSLVRRRPQLEGALAAARAASRTGAALVEEYVDGPEVTVSGFSAGGEFRPLVVADCMLAEGTELGPTLGHVWPSPHAEAAAEVTQRAVAALGIEEGPTLTRLRISRGGPEVIEVAARLGGGHDTELVELVTGVDLAGLALAAALGRPLAASEVVGRPRAAVGGAAVRFLFAPPGRLESIEVPQGLTGVVSTRLYREPGHVFAAGRRASDRAGAVLAVGGTRTEALARADAAAERIRFAAADADVVV